MSNSPSTESNLYTPEHLKRWTLPECYVGAEWPDYYVFLGHHRDSDLLTESNFDAGLWLIGGEKFDKDKGFDLVVVVRESHRTVS